MKNEHSLYKFIRAILILIIVLALDFSLAVGCTVTAVKYEFIDHSKTYTYNDLFGFDKSKTDISEEMRIYLNANYLDTTEFKGQEFFKNVKFVPLDPFLSEAVMIAYKHGNSIGTFNLQIYIEDNGVDYNERTYLLNEGCMLYGEIFTFAGSAYLYASYQTDEDRGMAEYNYEFNIYNYTTDNREKVGVYRLDGVDAEYLRQNFMTLNNSFKLNPWWWVSATSGTLAKLLIFVLLMGQTVLTCKLCDKLFYKFIFKSKGNKNKG